MGDRTSLRYLPASRVDGLGRNLDGAVVLDRDGQPLGGLVGVVVEPCARRLRYFVVGAGTVHRYLVPLTAVQLDREGQRLHLLAGENEAEWQECDPSAFAEFSAEDAVDAMFAAVNHTAAA